VEAVMSAGTGGEHHESRPAVHDEHDRPAARFDLRYLIGGLFVLGGAILVTVGFLVREATVNGIDINLWMGFGMFLLGGCFLLWALLRPLRTQGPSALSRAEQGAAERRGADADLGAGIDLGGDSSGDSGPRGRHRQRRPRWR
jgi:hypothetical protein